jgi:hypothetical protein
MPTETVEVPAYLIDELVAAARHAVAVLPDSRGGGGVRQGEQETRVRALHVRLSPPSLRINAVTEATK